MDYEKMEPRELDKAVCLAYGIKPKVIYAATAPGETTASWFTHEIKDIVEREIEYMTRNYPTGWAANSTCREIETYPNVSEDRSDMWLVVDRLKMQQFSLSFDVDYGIDKRIGWSVTIDGINLVSFEAMPARAICLAALRCMEAKA